MRNRNIWLAVLVITAVMVFPAVAYALQGEWIVTERIIEIYALDDICLSDNVAAETETLADEDDEEDAKPVPVWMSSDKVVAEVDSEGNVTTHDVDEVVTAFIICADGDEYKVWALKVLPSSKSMEIYINGNIVDGDTYYADTGKDEAELSVSAIVYPENAVQDVTINVSDDTVASLEGDTVRILQSGKFDLTVTTADRHNRRVIHVKCGIPVNDIEISGDKILISGMTEQLTAVCSPENASDRSVVWTSGNPQIVSVDSFGNVKAGKVTEATPVKVTACANDGSGVKKDFTILVKPQVSTFDFYLNDVKMTSNSMIMTDEMIGTTWRLDVKTYPVDARDDIEWATSDASVASISDDGIVTVNGAGQSYIVCKAKDGSGIKAGIYFVVTEDMTQKYYIEIDKSNQVVRVYEKSESGLYNKLIRRMVCSTGEDDDQLPDGLYNLDGRKMEWMTTILQGVCVQYGTRITGSIWFHSIPYYGYNADSMQISAYEELGRNTSHGCIRLLAADSKWIYENVEEGSLVLACKPGVDTRETEGLSWPKATDTWDPTDSREENPCYDPTYTSEVTE